MQLCPKHDFEVRLVATYFVLPHQGGKTITDVFDPRTQRLAIFQFGVYLNVSERIRLVLGLHNHFRNGTKRLGLKSKVCIAQVRAECENVC